MTAAPDSVVEHIATTRTYLTAVAALAPYVEEPAAFREDLAAIRAWLAEVEDIYPVAAGAQWQKSPASSGPRAERGAPRGSRIADPTAATALDERRLNLRAEVRRTEAALGFVANAAGHFLGHDVPPMYVRKRPAAA